MNWASFVALIRGRRADVAAPEVRPSLAAVIAQSASPPTVVPKAIDVETKRVASGTAKLVLLNENGDLDHASLRTAAGRHRGHSRDFADAVADALGGNWFASKVVGVTHRNDDGTSRQAAIKKLEPLDSLYLVSEPHNPYDPDAIRVIGGYFAKDFEWADRQIGYLNSRLAGETTRAMKRGMRYLCLVLDVTGEDQDHRGVNIAMVRWGPKG